MDSISINELIIKIETIIARLDINKRKLFEERLNKINKNYVEKINSEKIGKERASEEKIPYLTLNPIHILYSEYYDELNGLLEELTIEESIQNILIKLKALKYKFFYLRIDDLDENIAILDLIRRQYNDLISQLDSSLQSKINKLIAEVLYHFIYIEICTFDRDSIIDTLSERERLYLEKLMQDKISDLDDSSLNELVATMHLSGKNVISKEVILKIKETEDRKNEVRKKISELKSAKEEIMKQKFEGIPQAPSRNSLTSSRLQGSKYYRNDYDKIIYDKILKENIIYKNPKK